MSITFTASATGCPTPEYLFHLYTPGVGWAMVRDWAAGTTWQWIKANADPGQYWAWVYVRQAGATTFQAHNGTPMALTPPGSCTTAVVSTNGQPWYPSGTVLTATAITSGCTNPQYQFLLLEPGGAWQVVRPYTGADMWNFDTTGKPDGLYYIGVYVRQTGSPLDPEFSGATTQQVGQPASSGASFTITPGGLVNAQAGVPQAFTVQAKTAGGQVDTAYRGTVRFTSSDPGLSPSPNDTYTFTAADAGQHVFNVTFQTPGTDQPLAVTDIANPAVTGSITKAIVAQTVLSAALTPASIQQGQAATLTVQAKTTGGAAVTGYVGQVELTSTSDSVQQWGGSADLAGRYTFTTGDAGTHVFAPKFLHPGLLNATVTDLAFPTRTATSNTITVNAAPVDAFYPSGESEPSGVKLADGSHVWAYLSSRGKLYARVNNGTLQEPAWRPPVLVRDLTGSAIGAGSPSLALLGSTLALFHTYSDGTYHQVWVTTSTDNGATWGTPVKLTNETAHVQRIQTVVSSGTLYLFWSRHDTTGVVTYQTTTNLTAWSAAQTVGQTIGPSVWMQNSNFGITRQASGQWLLGWIAPSAVGEAPIAPGDPSYPTVHVKRSMDLTTWTGEVELTQAYSKPWPHAVALQAGADGTIRAVFDHFVAPMDLYIYQRTSTDGATWTAETNIGYDRSAPANGSQAYRGWFPTIAQGSTQCAWSASVGLLWTEPLQRWGRGSWAEPTSGRAVSLLDCAAPSEVLPMPYGDAPQTVGCPSRGCVLTGEATSGGAELSIPALGGSLTVSRTYASFDGITGRDGPFGYGWHWSYGVKAVAHSDGSVSIVESSGLRSVFAKSGSTWTAEPGLNATLTAGGGGGWVLTRKSQSVWTFDSAGKLTSIADRNGTTHTLTYTGANLSGISAPGGRSLTVTTNGQGRITAISGHGLSASYTYDANGNLATATNAAGKVTTYTYDARHQLLTVTDRRNTVAVVNTYGTLGRLTDQKLGQLPDPHGGYTTPLSTRAFVYANQGYAGTWGGPSVFTDGRSIQYRYWNDAHLRVTAREVWQTTTLAEKVAWQYNANHDVTQVVDPMGVVSEMTYDSRGNLLTSTADVGGFGHVATITYNSTNDLLTATDPLNHTATFTYDAAGNPLTAKNHLNQTTTNTYSSAGQLLTSTDAAGRVITNTYATTGDLATSTVKGRRTDYTYDTAGRVTHVKGAGPMGPNTVLYAEMTYDGMGRVLTSKDGLNQTTTHVYDNNGNKTSTTDPKNQVMSWTYDLLNRMSGATDQLNQLTGYAYDANGNLTSKADANNHTWTYTYDALNRPLTTTNSVSGGWATTYDRNGNPIQTAKPGITITNTFDTLNRLTRVQSAQGNVNISYDHDAAGRRTRMTDAAGTTMYQWDDANRLTQVTTPAGAVGYTYDAGGARTGTTYPGGRVVTWRYNTDGFLDRISTTAPATSADYEYTDFSALKQITYGNGVTSAYTYDAAQRVEKIEHKGTGPTPPVIEKAQYVLDAAGNRTSKTDQSGTTAYTYDAANQLKQQPVPGGTAAYTYDNVGNRTVEVTPSGTTNHTYDGANRLVSSSGAFSATYTFDPAGRQTGKTVGGVTTTYGYDALDRLLGFSTGTTSASYLYNGDGLRVRKTVGSTVTTHIWDINLSVPQVLTDGAADYLWGPEGLIAGVTSAGGITYAQKDAQGTPQVLTTGTAGVSAAEKYAAFGQPLPPGPPPGPTLPFGYTGEQTDAESGLVYLRARYMDPSTGRFLSLDPLPGALKNPTSQHGYGYAGNNPIRWSDPLS